MSDCCCTGSTAEDVDPSCEVHGTEAERGCPYHDPDWRSSYERAIRVPRRGYEPVDHGDMSVSYYEAERLSEQEMAECRCPRDQGGQPSPFLVNDLCEWHGGIVERALQSGRFWDPGDAWPWGEWDHMSPQPTGIMINTSRKGQRVDLAIAVHHLAGEFKLRTGMTATVVHCAPGEGFTAHLPVIESPRILKNCIWVGVE